MAVIAKTSVSMKRMRCLLVIGWLCLPLIALAKAPAPPSVVLEPAQQQWLDSHRSLRVGLVLQAPYAQFDRRLQQLYGANVELVSWLGAYERRANKPNLRGRLALLVEALGSEGLKERWRLSNDDVALVERVLSASRLLGEFRVNEAAYRFPAALADAIDVAATLANWTEAGKSAVLQHLEGIEVPTFPLSGNDLIARGMKPGPALGAELERLETRWIASNFKLGRGELLADLRL